MDAYELHLRIKLVLEIYAMLCLIGLPIVLVMALYLYKRTDTFSRINEWIDSFLGPPASVRQSGSIKEADQQQAQEPPSSVQDESCVPRFSLQTGESYRCWGDGRYKNWESDNRFVGTVGKDNVFTALKAGSCPVLLDGVTRFVIEVAPAHGKSFLDKDLEDIISGSSFTSVKSRLKKAPVIQSDTGNLPLILGKTALWVSRATYTHTKGKFDRVLYEIDDSSRINTIMDERFIRMKTEGETSVWYHLGDDNHVDVVAFARDLCSKSLLGIAAPWREKMYAAEAELNAVMTEKLFADLTGIPVSEIMLIKDEEERITGRVEASNDTSKADIPPIEEMDTPESAAAAAADEIASGQFEPEGHSEEEEEPEGLVEPEELAIEPEAEENEDEPEDQRDEMPDISAFASAEEDFYDGPAEKEAPSFDI